LSLSIAVIDRSRRGVISDITYTLGQRGVANLPPTRFFNVTFDRIGILSNAFAYPFSYSIRIRRCVWSEDFTNSTPLFHGKPRVPSTPDGNFRCISVSQERNELAAKFQRLPHIFDHGRHTGTSLDTVRCRPTTGNSNGGL